ncbi:MAG: ribonuclease D, partial [Myxococcales bacterium]|nr:ribonuclease D [Myxococcales bacterium]
MIASADALTAYAAAIAGAPEIALDTEFMREKTYRAELCLLQIANGADAVCIDPLALTDLTPLIPALTGATVKIMHAARQDLEVLLPAVGLVRPVFDTQIAAALAGHPAQVGYAELTRRLLGVELPKAHTRTDWSRR